MSRLQQAIHRWAIWAMPVLFLVSFLVVLALAPMKFGLLMWGLTKLCLGATAGFLIDWSQNPDATPEQLDGIEQGLAYKRRALTVAACIVAAGLIP